MTLLMNEHGEFVDDFDPYGLERRSGAYRKVMSKHDSIDNRRCVDCGKPIWHMKPGAVRCPRCQWMHEHSEGRDDEEM